MRKLALSIAAAAAILTVAAAPAMAQFGYYGGPIGGYGWGFGTPYYGYGYGSPYRGYYDYGGGPYYGAGYYNYYGGPYWGNGYNGYYGDRWRWNRWWW